ncbi:MAG TPA: VOC family protein, partial [Smithellaceae bacterium]|nr:VOC family protein [Smithellaceae bacterium]
LRFYTDVLGLELLEVVTVLDQPFYFVGNDTVRIEIEQANPAQIAAATGPQAGLYHLAFEVDDLEGAVARLRDAGAQFLLPPSQFREDRKIAFILDPDGVAVQLIQYLNRTP